MLLRAAIAVVAVDAAAAFQAAFVLCTHACESNSLVVDASTCKAESHRHIAEAAWLGICRTNSQMAYKTHTLTPTKSMTSFDYNLLPNPQRKHHTLSCLRKCQHAKGTVTTMPAAAR